MDEVEPHKLDVSEKDEAAKKMVSTPLKTKDSIVKYFGVPEEQ